MVATKRSHSKMTGGGTTISGGTPISVFALSSGENTMLDDDDDDVDE
jgi:hypothetical protein